MDRSSLWSFLFERRALVELCRQLGHRQAYLPALPSLLSRPKPLKMPRVANPPAGRGRTAAKQALATPHKQPPVKCVSAWMTIDGYADKLLITGWR
jgi:hypothetical protein